MMRILCCLLLSTICLNTFSENPGSITAQELKTEWMVNPLGVEVIHPGFSWVLESATRGEKQTAYQVLVASSAEILSSDKGDIWNSGRIVSDEQSNIIYKGLDLKSGARYYWKVQVWDSRNISSGWSPVSWWEMGLLNNSDWHGKWIGTTTERNAPVLRRDFTLAKKVKRATAHIYGLGWYELRLNGSKVGDQVLTPANTDYAKLLLYDSYDVTQNLKEGGNTVGIWLADGYGKGYSKWGWRWLHSKRAIMQLNIEYTDGSSTGIVTDESWKAADSQILSADMYNGEVYDATKVNAGWDSYGYNDKSWEPVSVTTAPPGSMRSNMSAPVRVTKVLRPVLVKERAPGIFLVDMGQNISGWVRLHVSGAAKGTKITMLHSEALKADGTLDTFTNREARATDTYICNGGAKEIYEPRFTYHGFRYVEIKGYPGKPSAEDIEGCVVHAYVKLTGRFSCSDTLLNKIHSNFQWTMLNNMVSIPTDNPVRDERTPCQMDANCIYEAAIQNFDVQQYFKNWLNDIYGSTSNPDWSAGQVLGPWLLYQYYGDKRILESYYPSSKLEVDYCIANADSSKYWKDSFGDWCPPVSDGTYTNSYSEGEIVNTSLYYGITDLLSRIAGILGRDKDSAYYAEKAKSIHASFNKKLFDNTANKYGSGMQVTFIMPLMCGLVPEEKKTMVFENLAGRITGKSAGHFGTGIYGTSFLPDLLCDYGRTDLAYSILTQTTYPSFGDQILNHGATTVWEQWGMYSKGDEMETLDHAMYSGADKTFYTRFGGIQPLTPGYRTIRIKPYIPEGLSFVRATVGTAAGPVTSDWEKKGNLYTHDIVIPVNTTALVYIPGDDPQKVYENGVPVLRSQGVRFLRTEGNYLVYEVVSGSYHFSYGQTEKEVRVKK